MEEHTKLALEDAENYVWNRERVKLQVELLEAVNALAEHTGSNDFWLPYGHGNWHFEHDPE